MKNQTFLSLVAFAGIFISSASYGEQQAQAASPPPPECQLSTVHWSSQSLSNYLTIPEGSTSKVCQKIVQVPYNLFRVAYMTDSISTSIRDIDFIGNGMEFGFVCGSGPNDQGYHMRADRLGKSIATESYKITCFLRDVYLPR